MSRQTGLIVEYKVVFASFIGELAQKVRGQTNEGWKPQGGVAISQGQIFYQALTRTSYEAPEEVDRKRKAKQETE